MELIGKTVELERKALRLAHQLNDEYNPLWIVCTDEFACIVAELNKTFNELQDVERDIKSQKREYRYNNKQEFQTHK